MKDPYFPVISQLQFIFGWLGDIIKLFVRSSQDWHSELIFLYLIDAANSLIVLLRNVNGFLKSINIDFPELENDFSLTVPNSTPISSDLSFGPSYIRSLFIHNSI